MERYREVDGKKLKYGYTTGSCATAATKAATYMLLNKEEINMIKLMTPKGWELELEVEDIEINEDYVSCSITKDSGDDPDVTQGIKINSKVSIIESGIEIDGGKGVGRVTKPGLYQNIGEAAINKTPREMITKEVSDLIQESGFDKGIRVEISAINGEEIGKNTFNPSLGIIGGISIIGTTGIVEPMSESAIVNSIKLELNVMRHESDIAFVTIGNYGTTFLKENIDDAIEPVKISNFIAESFIQIKNLEFKEVRLLAHIGKIVKIAGGITNTHSKYADCRMEILASYTALCGGSNALIEDIFDSVTTDEAIKKITKAGLLDVVMNKLLERIEYHLRRKMGNDAKLSIIIFSNAAGILGHKNAEWAGIDESKKITKKVSIVGMGVGNDKYLLPLAWEKIFFADTVIGAKRHIDWIKNKNRVYIEDGLLKSVEYANENFEKENIAFLVSGDTGFYSLTSFINKSAKFETELVPGISSIPYLYSKLGREYKESYLTSLHGRENDFIEIAKTKEVALLTDKHNTPSVIAKKLKENGINKKVIVGEKLSYEDERIDKLSIDEAIESEYDSLCVVVLCDE